VDDFRGRNGTQTGRRARTALLVLTAVAVLMFVVSSAHLCKGRQSKMNLAGGYWAVVSTGGGPQNTYHGVTYVSAHSIGSEACDFLFSEDDWNSNSGNTTGGSGQWAGATARGLGGYSTDGCLLDHSLHWVWAHTWDYQNHPDDGTEGGIDCQDLDGRPPGCGSS
jgi:hypothetical protein